MIIIKSIRIKIAGTLLRTWHAFYFLPIRLVRLIKHVTIGLLQVKENARGLPISAFGLWLVELPFLIFDLLAFSEVTETINDWLKWGTRTLTKQEEEISRSIFGSSIDYSRVRVDESSRIMCRDKGLIYVSFFTINSWRQFGAALFIHEMVHVWQYQKFGAIYIPRSLLAQRTKMGYNYGGLQCLRSTGLNQGSLLDFNFEQQADLIADGYSLQNRLKPRWVEGNPAHLPLFEKFLREVRQGSKSDPVK